MDEPIIALMRLSPFISTVSCHNPQLWCRIWRLSYVFINGMEAELPLWSWDVCGWRKEVRFVNKDWIIMESVAKHNLKRNNMDIGGREEYIISQLHDVGLYMKLINQQSISPQKSRPDTCMLPINMIVHPTPTPQILMGEKCHLHTSVCKLTIKSIGLRG